MNFYVTPPLIWDVLLKTLAVEMLCVKNEKSFNTRYFLLTRHVNVIFFKLEEIRNRKLLFEKFTYPIGVHSVF